MLPIDHRQHLEELVTRLCLEISPEFIQLLAIATTHPSMRNSDSFSVDYERLEFLGDSVLGFIIAELLYQKRLPIPSGTEGDLTEAKSKLTRDQTLTSVAEYWGLKEFIQVSNDHNLSPRVCADVVEAIFGACYLNYGIDRCRDFLLQHLGAFLIHFSKAEGAQDNPKNRIQEIVQQQTHKPPTSKSGPTYQVIKRTGPDHAPTFYVKVMINIPAGAFSAIGSGKSKIEAEMAAARTLLEDSKLDKNPLTS